MALALAVSMCVPLAISRRPDVVTFVHYAWQHDITVENVRSFHPNEVVLRWDRTRTPTGAQKRAVWQLVASRPRAGTFDRLGVRLVVSVPRLGSGRRLFLTVDDKGGVQLGDVEWKMHPDDFQTLRERLLEPDPGPPGPATLDSHRDISVRR